MTTLISAENTWLLFSALASIAAVSIYLERTFKWASRLTGCVIALFLAMLVSNLRIVPAQAPAYDFVWTYVVPAAIPMLLFNANIRKIRKESGRMLIIYLISGIGTVLGGFLAYFIFNGKIQELDKITAMMVGTYTGGSVNLIAIADAFSIDSNLISASVVADNLLMALYIFVLIAIPSNAFFKKHFRHSADAEEMCNDKKTAQNSNVTVLDIAKTFAISIGIAGVSAQLAALFSATIPQSNLFLAILNGLLGNKYMLITTITVLAATFLPKQIGSIPGAQEIGTFFVHIFFAVIGVPASFYLISTRSPLLLLFCAVIVATNMLVSFTFGKLFGFKLEEICIASNANIGGPTTAAAYAIAKGWQALVVPSLLIGTLGYVIGNYYGLFIGTIFAH